MTDSATFPTPDTEDEDLGEDLGGLDDLLAFDWQYKENVRAKLRTMIKALLKRYKYPPDQEPAAIELVLQQTEMISEEWAREYLGDKIQAAVADAPPSDGP